jgi:hypothetical protein
MKENWTNEQPRKTVTKRKRDIKKHREPGNGMPETD